MDDEVTARNQEAKRLLDILERELPRESTRYNVYLYELAGIRNLDIINAYFKLLMDKEIFLRPDNIKYVVSALQSMGHEEIAPIITRKHVDDYSEGLSLFNTCNWEYSPESTPARGSTAYVQQAAKLYAITDDETRAYINANPMKVTALLWDERIDSLTTAQYILDARIKADKDGITEPLVDGVL